MTKDTILDLPTKSLEISPILDYSFGNYHLGNTLSISTALQQLDYKPALSLPDTKISDKQAKVVTYTLDDLVSQKTKRPIEVGCVSAKTNPLNSRPLSVLPTILRAALSGRYDIVVAPEYSFFPEMKPLEPLVNTNIIGMLKEASKSGVLLIPGTFVTQQKGFLHNTCYAFYNGEIIYTHEKCIDGGEEFIAGKLGLKPNYGKKACAFEWEKIKIGIEICMETGMLSLNRVRDRDLVFLISCGNDNLEGSMHAVKPGGYGIVVDGCFGICNYTKQGQSTRDVVHNFVIDRYIKREEKYLNLIKTTG